MHTKPYNAQHTLVKRNGTRKKTLSCDTCKHFGDEIVPIRNYFYEITKSNDKTLKMTRTSAVGGLFYTFPLTMFRYCHCCYNTYKYKPYVYAFIQHQEQQNCSNEVLRKFQKINNSTSYCETAKF